TQSTKPDPKENEAMEDDSSVPLFQAEVNGLPAPHRYEAVLYWNKYDFGNFDLYRKEAGKPDRLIYRFQDDVRQEEYVTEFRDQGIQPGMSYTYELRSEKGLNFFVDLRVGLDLVVQGTMHLPADYQKYSRLFLGSKAILRTNGKNIQWNL